jgi:hypothetical protein
MAGTRTLLVTSALAFAFGAAACTDNSGVHYQAPDEQVVTKSTNEAVALLGDSPTKGFLTKALASGHDRADDEGHEVSETVTGRALFQVACSGTGQVTVTLPRQDVSRLVTCGAPAASFAFRDELTALVVGQRSSTGAYAWRILPKK